MALNSEQSGNIFDANTLRLRQQRAAGRFKLKKDKTPDFLLRHIADDLNDRLDAVTRSFNTAVDLFGRNGTIASALANRPNISSVSRIENSWFSAPGDNIEVRFCDDEHLVPGPAPVDLVVAAFALHWSADLPGALIQIRKMMQPDGLFLASLPGPDTLIELRKCLSDAENEISGGLSPRVDPFVTVQVAGSLLQRAGFALPVVDSQRVTVNYNSMFDLIRDLRAMGATNALKLREKSRFHRKLFERAAEIYSENYSASNGRISATFEIISLSGWAPHASQQKPLKPGSATVNLADLLK